MKPQAMRARLKKNSIAASIAKNTFVILLIFLVSSCTTKESKQNNTQEKASLQKTLEEFNTAFANGNVSQLRTMITDNYQHTNGSSKAIGKEDWLAYLTKRQQALTDGSLKVHTYSMDQLGTELFGNTAIVTARVTVDRTQNGQREQSKFRVTTFWVKTSEGWKRAGFHDGRIE